MTIVTLTECNLCGKQIDITLPHWSSHAIIVFPEKTPRIIHFCPICRQDPAVKKIESLVVTMTNLQVT